MANSEFDTFFLVFALYKVEFSFNSSDITCILHAAHPLFLQKLMFESM